jgi:transposase
MIDYDTFHRIKRYQQEGLNAGQIAQKLELDLRTIDKWLPEARYRPRESSHRGSKLDPYKEAIVSMLERHTYSAMQCFFRVQEDGFPGSYEIVKEYVRKVRPKRPEAFLTLAFAPGECAQVDWGHYQSITVGDTRRQLYFFVMVLCHSRVMYVEFTLSLAMEFFLACHVNAFRAFGGVPHDVMIDNLKTGVLSCRPGEEKVFNPHYQDFADHYGFTIKACAVRKGNEKGRVENAVGYVKKNFLNGHDFTQFDQINSAAKVWQTDIANVRIHGQTRKRPVDLLAEDVGAMLALPGRDYDVARTRTVRSNKLFRVTLDTNRYSVPAEFASQTLTMKLYPDRLCLYHENQLIARHARCFDRHQDIEDPDHPRELLEQRRHARDQKLFQRFVALSPKASEYYQGLEQKRMNARHHVQKIVALSEIYGREATARAMQDALQCAAYSCEYIANLLEQRAHPAMSAGALHLTHREDLLEIELNAPDMAVYDALHSTGKPS